VDKKIVKRNVGILRKVSANVLGVVLNAMDVKTQGYYYYSYHQEGAARGRKPAPPVGAVKG
jgi:Mrp family chromosome partitioning ATPase